MPHEIVLDANVLVAAFRAKRGASYELVRSIGRADLRLNVSVAVALEYEDVLKRNGILQRITEPEIDDFLEYVLELRATHNKRVCFGGRNSFGVAVRTPDEFLKMLRERQ